MYRCTNVKSISSEVVMMDYLLSIEPLTKNGEIAIVGGHFILFYDKKSDKLKPLIYNDLSNKKDLEFAELFAGDFPTKSFEYSIRLIKHYLSKNNKARNVFLINDHKFQALDFQPNTKHLTHGKGGVLRKSFYRDPTMFPSSFSMIIRKYGFDRISDVVFENYNSNRQPQDILPNPSFFFSEQALRTRFDKKTKSKRIKEMVFIQSKSSESEHSDLYYSLNNNQICLTESGHCGCSLEVMEFIHSLVNHGFQQIIFFVPIECKDAVNIGIGVALDTLNLSAHTKIEVTIVTSIGGMNFRNELSSTRPKIYCHELIT
jgi:hypothetical protein